MLSDATSVLSDKDLAVGGSSLGHMVKYVEFHGVAAHAASAPQDGVNALKAVNIAMIAMDSRCESFEDEDKVRVHGILTEGGTSVNSIPSIAKLEWRVRGKTIHVVDKINKKIDRSIKAGALAMGAKVRIRSIAGNLPMLQDNFMNDLYLENARSVVGERNVVIHPADQTFGSTDMGDLSQIIPIIHPRIGGAIGNGHGNNFYITDYEKSVFNPAKAMAMTIVDLLWHEDSKSNEILENHKPVFTRSEYVNMQNERMGNEFYDYS
jgi:metal-dependent amidase/aminoacylase/carboxypeptidase family protein